jgi:uroporphyrinogen decarboxylase
MMTKEERVLNVFKRKEVDYLPSMITFSDRTRDEEISKAIGLGDQSLDDYLENHIAISLTKADHPLFYRNDTKFMKELEKEGYCTVDETSNVVYDSWGMGILVGSDGFFPTFHPLAQKSTVEFAEKYMPPRIHAAVTADTLEERVKLWTPPDPDHAGNYDIMQKNLDELSGDYAVMASGYFGIYERAYGMIGFQNMFLHMAKTPAMIEGLLEKITDYKIAVAKRQNKLKGLKISHIGDDLGTQKGPFFSRAMFLKFFKPQFKRIFDTFKSADQFTVMHSCGHNTAFLKDLIEIGLDVLEPVQPCMDIKYIKKEFGKDLVFWGGIDTQELLPYATPAEVKKMAAETIKTLGTGGGHIIGPAQEIMNDVPLDNVVALVETIIEQRGKVVNL